MTSNDPGPKPHLSAAVARTLLDLLGTDDAFRARFAAAPSAALIEIGASEAEAEGCMAIPGLATKQEFIAARDALLAHLTEVAAFLNPHCFVDAAG